MSDEESVTARTLRLIVEEAEARGRKAALESVPWSTRRRAAWEDGRRAGLEEAARVVERMGCRCLDCRKEHTPELRTKIATTILALTSAASQPESAAPTHTKEE